MIQPGLERIGQLLHNVQFPWKAIHVAGTNGKGSICSYTSALLTRRLIKHGRFTSPHLVNRWDCICIGNEPVKEQEFLAVEKHFKQINERENISASEFELLTATAFQLFTDNNVDVGVVEVGMGGTLDATNILNNQVVSVISKIAHDHESFLGDTLEKIALHKAGILRPNVPYIVNPRNTPSVQLVIDQHAEKIGAGPRIDARDSALVKALFKRQDWTKITKNMAFFQQDNLTLAYLAFVRTLESLGLDTLKASSYLVATKRKDTNKGRLQVFGKKSGLRKLVVDGAHNPDGAKAIHPFISYHFRGTTQTQPITWILAMTDGKDAREYLQTLLLPGDTVITTTFPPVDGMPWVKPMNPQVLLDTAKHVVQHIRGFVVPEGGALPALCAAYFASQDTNTHVVLTGSLYLVGDFYRCQARGEHIPLPCKKILGILNPQMERGREVYEKFLAGEDPIAREYAYRPRKDEATAQKELGELKLVAGFSDSSDNVSSEDDIVEDAETDVNRH